LASVDADLAGKVRAEIHLMEPFPEGDWLAIEVVAQVYDQGYVEKYKRTADHALLAEGAPVPIKARRSKTVVDVPLPPMPFGSHPVVARVNSVDERYRKLFDPSLCFIGVVPYGHLTRIRMTDLEDVYRGIGNPTAEEEIKRLVRAGSVVVEQGGKLFQVSERDGRPQLDPYRQFEVAPTQPLPPHLAEGTVAIEGTNVPVAEIFAKNGELLAGQLAPLLLAAARATPDVAQRIRAMGPSPRFWYSLGAPVDSGGRVEFLVRIYARS
jgi:hypothetical protein